VLVCEAEGAPTELGVDKSKSKVFGVLPSGLPTLVPLRKRISQYLAIHGAQCLSYHAQTLLGLPDYGPAFLTALENLFCEINREYDYFGFQ
jgi:hypothetical protein